MRSVFELPGWILSSLESCAFCSKQAKYNYTNVFLKSFKDLSSFFGSDFRNRAVLILGCGYHYSDVILYSAVAKYVAGLDVLSAYYRDGVRRTFRAFRLQRHGVLSALVQSFLGLFVYFLYYNSLKKVASLKINHREYRLLSYDGFKFPFEDQTFDIVLSNAVLEHVKDLDVLSKEICRVTKRGGFSYHQWHNFYSFSGGHVSERLCRKYPWGHLRGKFGASNLNRLKPAQIQSCFSRYFDVLNCYGSDRNHNKRGVDAGFVFEGTEMLSPQILRELKGYSPTLLTTRDFLIVCRKK